MVNRTTSLSKFLNERDGALLPAKGVQMKTEMNLGARASCPQSLAGERLAGETPALPGGHPVGASQARRLRVLIVAPSLDILGGQAIQAGRLLARFAEEPSLDVAFVPINPRLPGLLGKLQKIKYVRTMVTSLCYWGMLLNRVRQYDIIHIFSASYWSFVLAPTPAILVAKLYGKRAVLNYRSGEAEDHLQRWQRTALPTIRLVDRLVVPSGFLVDVFARFDLRAEAIFNFVDMGRFRFRRRAPLKPVFLSNRNHEPLYNVGCILRAFAIIQKRFTAARLIVAGDGSQRPALEALAQSLGLREVEFIGRVAPERMPELYDAADIYLNSPNIDNMPGSIIEAYASGLPVVTTDAGGIPYIVTDGETGLMVGCDDHEAMAARTLSLLEDEALAPRLIARARDECRKYEWQAVRNEWLKFYYSLAPRYAETRPQLASGSAQASAGK
jgi:glycosyltransferase involved in cell wall biosynthesis